ncbi:phospholipase D-like domain-containing protein [Legionella maceachernii]|uniref:phospholipase D-like domain-containing protein n=1 Tax=Legionella maceachernii TaxID=466 RepID=UPI0011C02F53|nr:phospholipase D-like domain-containing protein [Legionella maceachernii]
MKNQAVTINSRRNQRTRSVLYVLLTIFLLFSSTGAYTEVYPWVWLGKNDIQVTDHAKVEAEFRLYLIATAQESIDIATFDQRLDEAVGLPLLQALEKAAERGVRIRFAAAWISALLNDPSRKTEEYLNRIARHYPNFKFISAGGPSMWKKGWGVLDGIHEKLFLVDNKIALLTGRGHAGEYLNWLDTAFFYKGNMVNQSLDAFEQMWQTIERENGLQLQHEELGLTNAVLSAKSSQQKSVSSTLPIKLSAEEQQELDTLKTWAEIPASNDHDYQARSIYYNFLEQMRREADLQGRTPGSFSYDEREKFLQDPFVDTVLLLLPQTHRFQMSILATILEDRIVEAIFSERQRGMEMELITNGKKAHSVFPTAPGWYAGIHTLDDLLQVGVIGHELKQRGAGTNIYLHRKLLILDDHVFFGSHNLTKASTLTNDEYSIEVVSRDFADKMEQLSRHSIEVNTVPFNIEAVHWERLITPVRQWFASFFEILYLQQPQKH